MNTLRNHAWKKLIIGWLTIKIGLEVRMKILVTGGAGFIGSNLVKKMYKNSELILVDDLSEGSIFSLPKILRKKLTKC